MSRPGVQLIKILSKAYSEEHLPQDWADMTFLVPHESIRRQMNALQRSVEALPEVTNKENRWKVNLLAKWFNEVFQFLATQHLEAIQQVYIPFLAEHGAAWPDLDHSQIIVITEMLQPIHECCKAMQDGIECTESIVTLKEIIPPFLETLSEHMDQLETKLPPLIRTSVTEKQNAAAVSTMIAFQGLQGLMKILPGILLANQEWMTRSYYAQYLKKLPPPVLKAQVTTLIPNYCHYYMRMRDAPMLASPPALKEIAWDDPSILAPPKQKERRNV